MLFMDFRDLSQNENKSPYFTDKNIYLLLKAFQNRLEETESTARLIVSYFNGIWIHSRKKNTAAMREELAGKPWSWKKLLSYPTLI